MRRRLHVVESLSDAAGVVEAGATKNYERRVVPIPAELVDPLRDHVAGRARNALVFANRDGGYVRHNNWYRRRYVPALQRAGMPERANFHTLRHTCAALLAAQGLTELEVMTQLGHRQPVATYRHLFADSLARVADALDATIATAREARAVGNSDGVVVELARGFRGDIRRGRRRGADR
jgi:integrase